MEKPPKMTAADLNRTRLYYAVERHLANNGEPRTGPDKAGYWVSTLPTGEAVVAWVNGHTDDPPPPGTFDRYTALLSEVYQVTPGVAPDGMPWLLVTPR